jgi:drug/metabolite transporter (DMT)-like permease
MTSRRRGTLALILLAASFALMTVLARYLNTSFTIAQQVYLRGAAALLVAGLVFNSRIRWRVVARVRPREWGVIAIRALLLYPIGTELFSKAATLTLIGDVSFIAALPLVSILALALRQTPLTRRRIGSVAGCVAGVAAVSLHDPGRGIHLPVWDRGDLLALLGLLGIAVSYLGRSQHDGALNNAEITVLLLSAGVLWVALGSFVSGQSMPHLAHAPVWGAVMLAGVLNALNVFLINYGFEQVEPVRAGNLLTLEAVWGLAFGLAFYRQWPTVLELLGGAAIVGCALILNSARDQASIPDAPSPQPSSRKR